MNRKVLPVLIALLLVTSGRAEDRRVDKSRLVVMTFNTKFMWDGVAPEEGLVNFSWKFSQTEAEEHMDEIAKVIIRNDPDIINLAEIENENALNVLNTKFLPGRGYAVYFAQGIDTTTGQDVGLLTRIDPEGNDIERYTKKGQSGGTRKSVSKNYFAKFDINGKQIALVAAHLLAHPNSPSRKYKRQAQADAIGDVAEELADHGYAVIILGDFNDYDGQVKDHIDSQPITNVLWRMKRMQPGVMEDDLTNVAEFVPKPSRYTAFWDKNDNEFVNHPEEHTSIDHILISSTLKPFVEDVDMPHVLDPRIVSDHYPVVLTLQVGDGEPTGVVICRLYPNPDGDENVKEEASIKNTGSEAVDLAGYKLRDLAGTTWSLDSLGTLNPGQEKTIKRNGQRMGMNNGGDTIELLDDDGRVVYTITYDRVDEGEVVFPE
jgi:endonuclease/exonuclease/phosphatase family metal-dependent hydrolase